jgi:hypothetical protein
MLGGYSGYVCRQLTVRVTELHAVGLEPRNDGDAKQHQRVIDGSDVDLSLDVLAGMDDFQLWENAQSHRLCEYAG